jgi:hypothetical protein
MIRSLVNGPADSTPGYVKLLLPPRQSRGNSYWGLGAALRKRESHLWHRDLHDWYVEPIWVSERLFATVPFITGILDPACGCGRW